MKDNKVKDTITGAKDLDAERRVRLLKQIEEKKAALAELKDGKLDTGLLDSLLDDVRLHEQPAVEVIVPLEEVIKTYELGAFSILRCKYCYVWKMVNYRAVVWPTYNYDLSNGGGALYSTLTEFCDLADKKEAGGLTEDESRAYALALMLLTTAFSLPTMMFTDTRFSVNVYKYIMDEYKAALERSMSRLNEETAEDIAANQAFESMMREDAAAKEDAGNKD